MSEMQQNGRMDCTKHANSFDHPPPIPPISPATPSDAAFVDDYDMPSDDDDNDDNDDFPGRIGEVLC